MKDIEYKSWKLIQVKTPDEKEPSNNKPIQSKLFIILHFPNSQINSVSVTQVQSPNSRLRMTTHLPSFHFHTDLHFIFHRLCSWYLPALSVLGTHSSASSPGLQQRDAPSFNCEQHLIPAISQTHGSAWKSSLDVGTAPKLHSLW